MVDIFSVFFLKLRIYSQDRYQKLSSQQIELFPNKEIYFWNIDCRADQKLKEYKKNQIE